MELRQDLLVQKKKYGCWIINEEGKTVDKVKVTGLDIIRSETSKPIKASSSVINELIIDSITWELISLMILYFAGFFFLNMAAEPQSGSQ